MNDQIICPHCKNTIPLTQALTHKLQEQYQKEFKDEREKLILLYQRRLKEESAKITIATEEKLRLKIKKDLEFQMKDNENAKEELEKANKILQEQLLETSKLMRQLKQDNEQKKLELEKRLAEGEEHIRQEEKKRLNEEYRLKILEKDKKLNDAIQLAEEYRRKLEQGSQQLQGEVLELELEQALKHEFPTDEIRPVVKGVRGADLLQIVKTRQGRSCGSIAWEFKRTKSWSTDWIVKLKEDQRAMKAELAVIVTQVLPFDMKRFGTKEGIWIGEYDCFLGLAYALRTHLLGLSAVRVSSVDKNEKMAVLYNYLSGVEFKQRIEAIVEAFTSLQLDIEKEKRFFATKWSKQEKNMRKVLDNTLGMHGDLESIIGKELGELPGLEALPDKV